MKKYCLLFVLIIHCIGAIGQVKQLTICKNKKVKLTYKQGQVITLSTNKNDTLSGIIYLIDEEYIYLNKDQEIAINDIAVIHPLFKPNFSFYKPENVKDWVNMLVLSFATIMLSPTDLYNLWMPNAQQQVQLSKKQRRLNKKKWVIGTKFKLKVR